MDVHEQWQRVAQTMRDHNYTPRDADQSDFQFGTDRSLRFKVGTANQEVTTTVWSHARQIDYKRATTPEQVTDMLHWIDGLINRKAEGRRVEPEVYGG